MRSIAVLIVFTLFLFTQAQAQRTRYATLKGVVIDSMSRQPIEAATVSVFLLADSSLITYAITNKKGEFLIKEIPQAKLCRVLVSYSGLSSYIQDFIISPETKELIINTVQLRKAYTELEEVIVSARRPPILIKNDTLEFDAGSFRTAPNAVVEDLLKQLPGVEVDAEGNITVNGKRVTKITVNGKDFFGSDFKLTSKNLPRDIIDKIQVVDFKSFEARFNKATTGNEDKAINLVLKKDMNKGAFGRGSVGYGSDKRHESGASINYFNGPLQLSFIGYANNTNQTGLGRGVSINNTGSVRGGGITESKGAGLNFNNEFGKKIRITGSYFFNNSYLVNTATTRRLNILPDTTFFYNAVARSTISQNDHRLNLNINYDLDSLTSVVMNAVYNNTVAAVASTNEAVSSSIKGVTINTAANFFGSRSGDSNSSLDLFIGRHLNERGRGVTFSINYSGSNRRSLDANWGNSVFYKSDSSMISDSLNQQSRAVGNNNRLNLSASFNEPLTFQLNLELRYTYSRGSGFANKSTNRFNPLTGQYDLADTLFSNAVRVSHRAHYPFLAFGYNTNKLNATIGAGVQWLLQENSSVQTKDHMVQDYTSIFPFVNIIYRYSKTGNIHLNYNGRSQPPAIDQLQTAPDNRNILYIRLGNPNLRASFFHSLSVNWQQTSSKIFWNGSLGLGAISNLVVYETWLDSVQVSRPINSNGNYNLTGNLSFTRSWKKNDWFLRLTLTSSGYFNRNVAYSNKIENITRAYSLSQLLGLNCTFKRLLTLMPTFSIRYNDTRYSIEQAQATENMIKGIAMNVMINWPKRVILEKNVQYNHNSHTAPGFPKGVTMWNLALNYQLFKNKQGQLRLSVYDLLKKNASITRSLTPTYIEDTQVQVLGQYFLVSFLYNLKQIGK